MYDWEMMMIREDCRGDNTRHSTVRPTIGRHIRNQHIRTFNTT